MHALVEVSADGRAVLSDAGSRNGTWVNGARVTGPTALDDGSVVRIGNDTLRWAAGGGRTLRVLQTADGRLEFDRVFAAAPAIPVQDVDRAAQRRRRRGTSPRWPRPDCSASPPGRRRSRARTTR